MEKKLDRQIEGHLALVSTALFSVGAVLLTYALYLTVYYLQTFTMKGNETLSYGHKFLVYGLGCCLAGLVFSVWVVSPTMRRSKQERFKMDCSA
jgi:hypothetical protein